MAEVNVIDWHVNPFRADRWYAVWLPALEAGRRVRRDLVLR